MNYRLLQQHIKLYKQAGYTNINLNLKKTILEAEYKHLLKLELSQEQLDRAITNRYNDRLNAIDPIAVYASPESYNLMLIKHKVFQLAKVATLKELKQSYPIINEQGFNFRYKLAWSKCLKLIAEITEPSRENDNFYRLVERAIEIELKCKDDDFYRHETSDADLYTFLSDHNLVGSSWNKNHSVNKSLKRIYILNKCRDAGLDPKEYALT
jgi:hypothetical protein